MTKRHTRNERAKPDASSEPGAAGPRRCPIRALIELEPVARSPRLARRFVADTLGPRADIDLLDAAELLVTELVTNAVVHARSPARVLIVTAADRGRVRIEVHDDAHEPPRMGSFDPDAISGRGLALVDAMSDRWGVEPAGPTRTGKRIWFELRVRTAEPSSAC